MNGVICLDTATASSQFMATTMEGVKKWNTKGLTNALFSIGGLKVTDSLSIATLIVH